MGCIYIGPIYIKRQSDSDNFLTFWYTLMNTLSVRLRLATPVIIILPLLGILRLMGKLVMVVRIMTI